MLAVRDCLHYSKQLESISGGRVLHPKLDTRCLDFVVSCLITSYLVYLCALLRVEIYFSVMWLEIAFISLVFNLRGSG